MENSVTALDIMAYRVMIAQRNEETAKAIHVVSHGVAAITAIAYGTTFWGVVWIYVAYFAMTAITMYVTISICYSIVDWYVIRQLSK